MTEAAPPTIRMTRQRRVILEALRRSPGHLTGDEIYRLARRRMPHISLGTVYRNLELLSEAEVIRKVELAGTPRRFDVTVEPHYHIRCLECGKVEDVPIPSLAGVEEEAQAASGYQVVAHQVEITGFCPHCRRARGAQPFRRTTRGERS